MYYQKDKIYEKLKKYLKVEKGGSVPLKDFIRGMRMTTTIKRIKTVRDWYDYFKEIGYVKSTYTEDGYKDTMIFFLK